MYKALKSLWSKPISTNETQLTNDSFIDEDSWVIVSENASVKNINLLTNSWIESPPLIKPNESSTHVHHFNPIENLLIEHASMSVYDQIGFKNRNKRQDKYFEDKKLDGQVEKEDDDNDDDDDDDDDEKISIDQQCPNVTSIHNRNLNISTITNLDSSLFVHNRHLNRLYQRRKRSTKLISTNSIDGTKQADNENIERQRFNHLRPSKKFF